ncbi:hypothetical protein TRV_03922 [Trichophyton verrucosum HKI 0517]|uniref:26S proteasome complex subunit SEM1 n=1 Tax=Trichophyton verrucosum (strain HKI 0517) TaxID=663202 RepID=D4D9X9_TRIVH|nr:uncharacterized protein TRV_03922 [Trichophyton verrucosum HKI 0517]EFE41356.1 hypothetical protein TRV_03922 [Trichophyton verrucosum HKI 0517]
MSSQPASQGAAKPQSAETAQSEKAQNLSAPLEEDDEFEDFPVEDWPQEEAEAPSGGSGNDHLWEESWDDDDASEDFSKQLAWKLPSDDLAVVKEWTLICAATSFLLVSSSASWVFFSGV